MRNIMRLNNKYLIVALTILLGGVTLKAQQLPVLSNYIYHPYLYNPARAGQGEYGQVFLNFKKQWDKMPYSPITNILAFDMPVKGTNMGIGAMIFMDKAHLQNNTGGMVSYAYHIPFNEEKTHRLSIGINAGVLNQKFDFQNAEVIDYDDPTIFDEDNGAIRFDMAAGMNYQFKGLNVGFAVPQLIGGSLHFRDNTQADAVQVQMERHYYAFASYRHGFGKTKDIYLEPNFALRKVTAIPMQFDMSVIFDYKNIAWVSTGYHSAKSFSQEGGINVAAGFSIKKRVSATYTFETVMGKNDRSSFGNSHEVLIGCRLGRDKKEMENKLNAVETNVVQNTEDIAGLKEDSDKTKADVETLKSDIAPIKEEVDQHTKQLNEIQDLLTQNTNSIQTIQALEQQKMLFKKLGSVYFNLDSDKLTDEAKSSLDALAKSVSGYTGDLIFYVAGSASDEGASDYNLILALRRSAAVKEYMKEKGLKGEVLVMTYGEESPDATDKAKNRRADIYVTGQQ